MAKAILKVLVYYLICTAWFYTHPHILIKTSLPASSSPHLTTPGFHFNLITFLNPSFHYGILLKNLQRIYLSINMAL